MGKLTVTGLDEYINKLNIISTKAHEVNRGALGEGAGYVADQLRAAAEGISIISQEERNKGRNKVYGATPSELAQILNNLGIKRFSEGGGKISTQIGFGGYVNTPSKKYNNHVPTGMLVQAINNGTEFRAGTHTLDKVTLQVKGPVQQKIQDYIDEKIKEIMN